MKLTFKGEIEHEILHQELVSAIGQDSWYLNGSKGEVTFIAVSEKTPDPTVVIEQHIANALNRLRAEKWEEIKAERDRRKVTGVKVGDHWFHSDADSRIQQLGLIMMGAGIPADLQWKTMSGEFVLMTPELASQVLAAVAAYDQKLFAVAQQHKEKMEASDEPEHYDFSSGWPESYALV